MYCNSKFHQLTRILHEAPLLLWLSGGNLTKLLETDPIEEPATREIIVVIIKLVSCHSINQFI